jgi:hypothetical protein
MQKDYIDLLESTPTLNSKKCRAISFILMLLLRLTTIISGVIAWYLYDLYVAIATLLVVFIIMGIVRSKLRNSVIPVSQSERHYEDAEIATWYTAKEMCNDELESRLEKI